MSAHDRSVDIFFSGKCMNVSMPFHRELEKEFGMEINLLSEYREMDEFCRECEECRNCPMFIVTWLQEVKELKSRGVL